MVIYMGLLAILSIPFWIVTGIVSLTINTKREYTHYSRFYGRYFSLVLRYACFLAGVRTRVNGRDKIKDGENYLFVINHRSNYDPMILAGELSRNPIAFISKPGNFKIPIGRRFMHRCGYLALNRENPREGMKTIKRASDMMKETDFNTGIGVCPEGTRNFTEETLLEFKPGCFKCAMWAKKDIVVCTAVGTENVHRNYLRRRTKVVIDILEVLKYEDIKGLTTIEVSDRVRDIMLKRLENKD